GSGLLTGGQASSAGVPDEIAHATTVLEYNNLEQIGETFAQLGDQIAAVIVEPIAGNMNLVRGAAEFLRALRTQCTEYGAVLIFDEVISGFRVALGGAQSLYGIRPDLTCLGKIIGGGFPLAAFGGRRDIMAHLAPLGSVYQAGTLSGNPVAVTAGLNTLKRIQTPGFYEKLSAQTERLISGIVQAARDADIVFSADGLGGLFGLYFAPAPPACLGEVAGCDMARFKAFFHAMLDHGIYLAPSP
ncbi:aminotransferase class III-fold pyridoxal phosphate-dependent enzyme, partial [Candidatus Glomeribacter gigasporarum]|uniref:aminotransferase class III-fold pyridoxal phosphate-dependent enzyme n=1 Tax=Candidatus Glomeribacter gigasporarum TaxID=132144 RepID=UPI003B9689B6